MHKIQIPLATAYQFDYIKCKLLFVHWMNINRFSSLKLYSLFNENMNFQHDIIYLNEGCNDFVGFHVFLSVYFRTHRLWVERWKIICILIDWHLHMPFKVEHDTKKYRRKITMSMLNENNHKNSAEKQIETIHFFSIMIQAFRIRHLRY